MTARIIHGDCREVLRSLPDESVHCVVTSPPYWGLRDYGVPSTIWGGDDACAHEWGAHEPLNNQSGLHRMPPNQTGGTKDYSTVAEHRGQFCQRCGAWAGALGLEPTPALYVEHMVAVFREVRRVLRKDGTLWLNLGDSYITAKGSCFNPGGGKNSLPGHAKLKDARAYKFKRPNRSDVQDWGLKHKDLAMMPARVAMALQADGWWLRQDIIWSKPNPMPESVTDRCTKAHEYLFLLSKSERYYFDQDAIAEPCESGPSDIKKMVESKERIGGKHKYLIDPLSMASSTTNIGRKRAVGGRAAGNKSHKYVTAYEGSDTEEHLVRNRRSVWAVATAPFPGAHFATFPPALIEPCILAGCPKDGTVLDPFGGAGTTGLVADRLMRNAILIELNPEYCAMADARLRGDLRDVEGEPAPVADYGPLFSEAAE